MPRHSQAGRCAKIPSAVQNRSEILRLVRGKGFRMASRIPFRCAKALQKRRTQRKIFNRGRHRKRHKSRTPMKDCIDCGGNHEHGDSRFECITYWKRRAIEAENLALVSKIYKSESASASFLGCGVCGGKMVEIRGRHPRDDRRNVCPTCLAERMDMIRELTAPDYGTACEAQRNAS